MADVVLPGPVEIVATTPTGESQMEVADVPLNVHSQALSRLSSAGASAHEHFIQFSKVLDLSYEQDRKMVSLVESLGVREVTSHAGQQGIPIASTIKGT